MEAEILDHRLSITKQVYLVVAEGWSNLDVGGFREVFPSLIKSLLRGMGLKSDYDVLTSLFRGSPPLAPASDLWAHSYCVPIQATSE